MSAKSEIQAFINNLEEKVKEYQRRIDDCDKQIARLKSVYQKLGEIKFDFLNARKNTDAIFKEKGIWCGNRHTSFCNAGAALDASYGDYYARLDAAQDAVNRKIGELESKKLELIPLIGQILSQINQLWVEYSNAVN